MDRSEVLAKIGDVIREVLDDDSIGDITESTMASDVDGWDSLAHIAIIASVEEEFDIKFAMKDVVALHNVGDLVEAILKNI